MKEKDRNYLAPTYRRFDLALVKGEGATCFDENGNAYIDMTSGIGVNAFGFCDPSWAAAAIEQLKTLQHTSNLYYTAPAAALAEQLCLRTGMKKVFFSNSGAEANECAFKVARKYAAEKKGDDYFNILTLENSFHGRTLSTLAATGQESFHALFQPLTPGFLSTPANDIPALRKALKDHKIAGVLIECIQGEGGVNVLEEAFVREIERLCRENEIVFMVDEVQTGNGRTGALYAYQHYGVTPDLVTTAKGLGGGLPIGATLMGEKVENALSFGEHGSTFGGNPVCCAAALSVFSRLTDSFLEEAKTKGEFIKTELEKDGFEVSGMGLMLGIKCEKPVDEVIKSCMDNGVLCLSAKEKLRLLPPLNIQMDELKTALYVIKEALKK